MREVRMNGIIFDIQRSSYVDGPGVRTTVFFKGCNLKCDWCHNPESQNIKPQLLYYKNKCIDCGACNYICKNKNECILCGSCALICPNDAKSICGRTYSVEEILKEIKKDKQYYISSNGGVTFSGGECMLQIDFLSELLRECKKEGIHTAVDTAGNVPFSYFERILPYTDIFLYDIKCIDPIKHKKYIGVDNKLILDNLKKLLKTDKKVIIRIPVVKDINDSYDEMCKIKEFLNTNGAIEKVELLPYHPMGEHKYSALKMEYKKFSSPSKTKLEELKSIFK